MARPSNSAERFLPGTGHFIR